MSATARTSTVTPRSARARRRLRRPHRSHKSCGWRVSSPEDQPPAREVDRMSIEDNKAVVGRWFTDFWGSDFDPQVIDELAAPDIRFEYSMHKPLRGRDQVRDF